MYYNAKVLPFRSRHPQIMRSILFYLVETNFKPTIDAIKVKRKNILQKSYDSLKKYIPIKTVPTAPIPVHIAYAVPMGMV